MEKINFKIKTLKILKDPNLDFDKYVGYMHIKELIKNKEVLDDWKSLNPRSQNLKTEVSRTIKESIESNENFHLLNRGILFSAKDVKFDNKKDEIEVLFVNDELHGNVDGGHTLKVLFEIKKNKIDDLNGKYVFFEIIKGINNKEEAIHLAEARNKSAAVDTKSLENLRGTFNVLKEILKDQKFRDRIQWKMFQKNDDPRIKMIDVRELIALMNIFNKKIYNHLDSSIHPIQSYSGKEVSLKKFVDKYGKNKNIEDIKLKINIWKKIFNLWDEIEIEIHNFAKQNNKTFISKYDFLSVKELEDPKLAYTTRWNQLDLVQLVSKKRKTYKIPPGIIYPIISAFRVLMDEKGENWDYDPIESWKKIGKSLTLSMLNQLDNLSRNPNKFAKTPSTWDSLYDKVNTYKYQKEIQKIKNKK